MSRIYSTRLAAGVVSAVATVVYTVPVGQKAVALDAEFLNVGEDSAELLMGLVPVGESGVSFWHLFSSPPMFGDAWRGRLVLNAGDSLVLTTEGEFAYAISGYLFLV